MASKLAEILFREYRRRVLALLLLNPDKDYHVREIARITGTVAGTLHKELARLEDAGILAKRRSGNQVLYSANRSCPIFEELAGILRKTSGLADVIAAALAPLEQDIDVAVVHGSMASGKETSGSDVDLLVVGEVKFADVAVAVHTSQAVLQREINPTVFTKKEWRSRLEEKDGFARELMEKPKLFILGSEDELG